jgi:type II secretory pathway pseudopilin PulG
MKLSSHIPSRAARRNLFAFTLVEMMMSVGIFLVIFVGVMVAVQIFGMRVSTLAATKLIATAGSRKAMDQIRDEIREAKTFYIGNCSSAGASTFTTNTIPNPQQGNALEVFSTTNSVPYSIYYLNTNNAPTNNLLAFNVTTNSSGNNVTNIEVLTSYITNQMIFDAEDYQGVILTNAQSINNRYLVKVTFQFSQWEYPIAYVGGVGFNAYDYYQLRTRILRRAWN